MKSKDFINEEWSDKYKRSINCASPKGFSQKAHCAGRKKNESVTENAEELNIGDPVVITGDVEFRGKTGDIADFGRDKRFVIVNLYNHGKHSFHSSDVEYNDYADSDDEQEYQQRIAEGEQTEDRHPNDKPYGPETKPTMPAGSVRVDVSDVYDWYKLGMHISDLKGLGKHDFGKGPPSTMFSFGSEEQEHEYIKDLEKTGLTTTDIDPVDPNPPKGMPRQKVDPTFNVNETPDADLAEPPERPRKTTTKTKPDIKFDIPFQQDQDQPLAQTDPLDDLKKKAGIGGDKPRVDIRKASQQRTLDKTAGIGSPEMGDMLSRLRNIEVSPDLDGYPDPEPPENLPSVDVNTKNLPAVAGQAIQAAGMQNPEFHQVANLPGNMSDQIRQLGKSLFGSLTMTPTKRIYVVANLGGQGPNTNQEVQAVAGFLKKEGKDLGPGNVDFDNVMPGYKADTHMFSAAGIRWMLVKDFAGQYIYCWPESDSHDAVDAIGNDSDVKRLK